MVSELVFVLFYKRRKSYKFSEIDTGDTTKNNTQRSNEGLTNTLCSLFEVNLKKFGEEHLFTNTIYIITGIFKSHLDEPSSQSVKIVEKHKF